MLVVFASLQPSPAERPIHLKTSSVDALRRRRRWRHWRWYRWRCWLLRLGHEEALIHETRDDQDNRHADKGADAVELAEAAEIVQKKLGERDNQQGHAGITDPPGLLAHADEKQCKGVEGPGDRIGHVASEIAREREGQRGPDGEIIGNL